MNLILASTSPYRRQLLERLGLAFECQPPGTDETALPDELPEALASRLALEKAMSVARQNPGALVIGSDQVAALGDKLLGKPGNHAAATEQLRSCSGRLVRFYTAVSVVCVERSFQRQHVEPFTVEFRSLSDQAIENYLRRDQPYDSAGSFRCEGLGIALFSRASGNDPSSLVGLPLISLTTMLKEAGIDIL